MAFASSIPIMTLPYTYTEIAMANMVSYSTSSNYTSSQGVYMPQDKLDDIMKTIDVLRRQVSLLTKRVKELEVE